MQVGFGSWDIEGWSNFIEECGSPVFSKIVVETATQVLKDESVVGQVLLMAEASVQSLKKIIHFQPMSF